MEEKRWRDKDYIHDVIKLALWCSTMMRLVVVCSWDDVIHECKMRLLNMQFWCQLYINIYNKFQPSGLNIDREIGEQCYDLYDILPG